MTKKTTKNVQFCISFFIPFQQNTYTQNGIWDLQTSGGKFFGKKMGIQAEVSKGLASSILFSLSIG